MTAGTVVLLVAVAVVFGLIVAILALLIWAMRISASQTQQSALPQQPAQAQQATAAQAAGSTWKVKTAIFSLVKWGVGIILLLLFLRYYGCFSQHSKSQVAEQQNQENLKLPQEKQSPPVPTLNRVDVNHWFNRHYASAEGFQPLFTPTELRFQVIPCLGYHLPPVNLALLPTSTEWTCEVEDGQEYGWLNNGHEKNLWLLGQEKLKKHTNMSMQGYVGRLFGDFMLGDNPIFLLEADKKEVKDKDERLQYLMKFTFGVSAEDNQLRRVFEKRFGLLKKQDNQYSTDDLDKDVKVMDLPALIEGQQVFWDLSIRCLPLWLAEVKDGKVRGRWMPNRQLSPKHLNFFTPQIKIAAATGTNVPGQKDQWIFTDSSGKLLAPGCFETSVERMKEIVRDSRHKQQQPKFDWLGDGALYVRVPSMLDEKGLPTGVTVQVVCRIRADNQSFVK